MLTPLKIACLCPTYGRPVMVQNTIALFLAQTHPAECRKLFILDDGGQYEQIPGKHVQLRSQDERLPSLPAKYAALTDMAESWEPDVYALWDDDDIYLPRHLERISAALQMSRSKWAHPSLVLSTYPGHVVPEQTGGRFWAAAAMRWEAWNKIGGVPNTLAGDFDQQFLGLAHRYYGPAVSPVLQPNEATFVFRWADTHCAHSQAYILSPDDDGWYARMRRELRYFGNLAPVFDGEFLRIWPQLIQLGAIDPHAKNLLEAVDINAEL